jgi:hypothetical protein
MFLFFFSSISIPRYKVQKTIDSGQLNLAQKHFNKEKNIERGQSK